jgi:hypothetical protein
MWKRLAMAGACALASVTATVPATAQDGIVIGVAPPAPRYEAVPPPRPGYRWAPGHWAWDNGRHVWVSGHWIAERPGMYWYPDRWAYRGGRWHLEPGGWYAQPYAFRDFDRDGVQNRYDRDRDNDGVRDRYDRDRDGDGVPNRFDSRPDNPYWR